MVDLLRYTMKNGECMMLSTIYKYNKRYNIIVYSLIICTKNTSLNGGGREKVTGFLL